MNEPASATKLPPDCDWKFQSIDKTEQGACFVWETFRNIPPPAHIPTAVISVAAHAAREDSFHRFLRRDEFRPLVLFAWLAKNNTWPDVPWLEASADFKKSLVSIDRLPAIAEGESISREFLASRYDAPERCDLDLLFFPFALETDCQSEYRQGSGLDHTGFTFYDLLTRHGALTRHSFTINWQHSRGAIVTEFKSWLTQNQPQGLLKYESGGRVDIGAWLWWLSAFRLQSAAHNDSGLLRRWKRDFLAERPGNRTQEKSVDWFAKKYTELVAEWLPAGLALPSKSLPDDGKCKQ